MMSRSWIAAAAIATLFLHTAARAAEPENKEAGAPAAVGAGESMDPALSEIDKFIADKKIDKTKGGWKTRLGPPPKLNFTAGKTYYWELETNVGNLVFILLPQSAPVHVSSTIYLTRLGFYDDLAFHRVIDGFMAQGGDPLGNGTGGPGYEYDGEFDKSVKHDQPGLLSMANAGPGTDGSQFFITFTPTPHLDGKHTIFGKMRAGKDVLGELEKRGTRGGKPKEPLKIVKATIRVE
jgi:peptidyl-prolyl cis-trans isomerase B (cyclophilin B)